MIAVVPSGPVWCVACLLRPAWTVCLTSLQALTSDELSSGVDLLSQTQGGYSWLVLHAPSVVLGVFPSEASISANRCAWVRLLKLHQRVSGLKQEKNARRSKSKAQKTESRICFCIVTIAAGFQLRAAGVDGVFSGSWVRGCVTATNFHTYAIHPFQNKSAAVPRRFAAARDIQCDVINTYVNPHMVSHIVCVRPKDITWAPFCTQLTLKALCRDGLSTRRSAQTQPYALNHVVYLDYILHALCNACMIVCTIVCNILNGCLMISDGW